MILTRKDRFFYGIGIRLISETTYKMTPSIYYKCRTWTCNIPDIMDYWSVYPFYNIRCICCAIPCERECSWFIYICRSIWRTKELCLSYFYTISGWVRCRYFYREVWGVSISCLSIDSYIAREIYYFCSYWFYYSDTSRESDLISSDCRYFSALVTIYIQLSNGTFYDYNISHFPPCCISDIENEWRGDGIGNSDIGKAGFCSSPKANTCPVGNCFIRTKSPFIACHCSTIIHFYLVCDIWRNRVEFCPTIVCSESIHEDIPTSGEFATNGSRGFESSTNYDSLVRVITPVMSSNKSYNVWARYNYLVSYYWNDTSYPCCCEIRISRCCRGYCCHEVIL